MLVAHAGRPVADISVGYSDIDRGHPVQEDTVFRIHSMTKPIVSVPTMMLVEQGRLRLEDAISRWLPDFASMRVYATGGPGAITTIAARRPITLIDLLTHTSGMVYEYGGDSAVHFYYRRNGVMRSPLVTPPAEGDGPPATSLAQLVERLGAAPLLHQPGEHFSYGYSTTILGAVIEQATGSRLDDAIREMITAPLGMDDTGFLLPKTDVDRFATLYALAADGLDVVEKPEGSDYLNPSRLLDGGGGMVATATDYMIFANMLANRGISAGGHRLLSESALDEMFKPRTTTGSHPPIPMDFALGFAIGDHRSETLGIQPGSTASWAGAAGTYFFVDPKRRAACVFMTQTIGSYQFIERIAGPRQAVNRAASRILAT